MEIYNQLTVYNRFDVTTRENLTSNVESTLKKIKNENIALEKKIPPFKNNSINEVLNN